MGITVTVPGTEQKIIVNAGPTLKSLGTNTMMLDGSIQVLHEQPGGATSQMTGYIDLSNLVAIDVIIVKFLVRLTPTGTFGACYVETYSGIQPLPIIHIAKRPENHGIRVTIQQIAGSPKNITYEFFEES